MRPHPSPALTLIKPDTPPPPPAPDKARVLAIDVFLHYLKAEGVRYVFGIPGGLLHPLFEWLEADGDLRLIVSKHEEGAAFMADGYARVSGKLAVCAGTSGPGSTNLLTGVACAFADGVPMLVITGQAASHALGKGAAQETAREDIDIVAMFRPVTKYSAMVGSAESLPQHLRRALRQALTGRPGPVHLNVPVDFWEKPVEEEWFDPSTYRPKTTTFDRNQVQRAAELLLEAKRPVILAGSGVVLSQAEDHLISLAELLPARVATSPRAKGVFPEDHPLSLGVLGAGGHREAKETVLGDSVDVLLTLGASLNETTTLNWHPKLRPEKALIQCDIDADRIGRNYPVEVPLVGDAQTIVLELIYHLHRRIRDRVIPESVWESEPPLTRGHARYDDGELRTSDALPLKPQRWRCDLSEVLPDDALLFSDIGGHMLFNIHHLCIKRGQRFVINLGFGSMGHGTVSPIGASLAEPNRPIIAIVGDACFTMNGMELLTASEYGIPVLWIVEHNNMHGITYHGSARVAKHGKPLMSICYERPIEVASIARSMGMRAWVVDAPGKLQRAVREWLSSRAPGLIEVRVDGSVSPPLGARVQSVAGFINR
jgi:acetolactate synthase I/II/III large subunit